MKPPIVAGALAALLTGVLMAALTASAGGLAASVPGIAVLTGALLVAGMIFGWLLQTERLRGGFGPGILYWIAGFPVARLVQELLVPGSSGPAGISQGIAGFLVFQALVGGAFGLGFLLLHNQIWMWLNASSSRRARSRAD